MSQQQIPESSQSAPAAEKTAEQLKQEKNDRIRRNLRILALCVAAYYFISAGYTWYEESQTEALQGQTEVLTGLLDDPSAFRDRFNASINDQHSILPTANANDTTEGFVAVLSPAVELRGFAKEGSKALAAVQLQTRYPYALPEESLQALRAFIAACENNPDSALADDILRNLGIEPAVDGNPDNKVFEPAVVQSQLMQYELTFRPDAIDELTVQAKAR